MKSFKKVNCLDLEENMILAKDIYVNNVKILTENTKLSMRAIKKLKSLYTEPYVYIYESLDPIQFEANKTKNSIAYKQTEENLKKFSDGAKVIFNKVDTASKIEVSEIREITDNIFAELSNVGIVIKNLIDGGNKDDYLFRHSVNVSVLCAMIGKWLKLDKRDAVILTYGGFLHDIGKIKINQDVLNKSTTLDKKEFKEIKQHPIRGYEIVKLIPYLDQRVELSTLLHHERIDGSGYPFNFKGEKIPTFAKIVSIADTFDAITSNRCYKAKQCPLKALEILKEESFNKLDPSLCDIFVKNMVTYYTGEYVSLSDGSNGKIVNLDPYDITHPLVARENDFVDLRINRDLTVTDIL